MRYLVCVCISFTILSCAGTSPRFTDSEQAETFRNTGTQSKQPLRDKTKNVHLHRKDLRGMASWYGSNHSGKQTASGELFDPNMFTAAHKKIPFGTIVEVIDQESGNSVKVKINDRGPYTRGRVIDLSQKAADKLGILKKGIAKVTLKVVK